MCSFLFSLTLFPFLFSWMLFAFLFSLTLFAFLFSLTLFTDSLIDSSIDAFADSWIHSFMHSCIDSFILVLFRQCKILTEWKQHHSCNEAYYISYWPWLLFSPWLRQASLSSDGDGNALGIRQPKHHEVLASTCIRFYLNSISL